MGHIIQFEQSCRLINTVVDWKRQKCGDLYLPALVWKYFLHFSRSPIWNWVQRDQVRGSLTCISAKHSNITAFLPSVCSAVSMQFPHRVLHVLHLYPQWPGSTMHADILEKAMVDLNYETPQNLLETWTCNLLCGIRFCLLGTILADKELPTLC